jgi:fibronectin type 3 domain-containing protein/glucose/arabinose dehydrogenase
VTSKNAAFVSDVHPFSGLNLPRAARSGAKATLLARATQAVVENLEGRSLFSGDASIIQPLPYSLDFESSAGGLTDKDGEGTGFTWVMPNKNNDQYQPSLIDMVGGRLRITTTGNSLAGGPWENDNTLVNALQTQFNGSTGSFSITTRMVGPFGYLDQASEQGGLIFGPDHDNYVKLVLVAQPNGRFLQFIDEQKASATSPFVHQISSANSYTNIGSFASINTIDLTLAGEASTGRITAYYRINGGTLQQVSQTLTLTGTQRTRFFSSAARAGLMAMQKNNLAPETLVFESFAITPGTPQIARPSIRADQVTPANGETNVKRDIFVGASLNLPNVGKGVDTATLNTSTVRLYRTIDRVAVPGHVSTSGAGDTITFQPFGALEANTQYTFEVTSNVKDTSGAQFMPFTSTFTTGTAITPTDPNIAFQKVSLPSAQGQLYSSVTMGPDGKLYASTLTGLIQRFSVNSDGTLGAAENITTVQTANGGNRFITGIAFDPASTANNLVLWVNNSQYAFENASDWTGKLSRLSGANLQNYQDYVTGLPRAIRDHLNNQIAFGPDGLLYFAMGSNSAMGAADAAWGLRPERLLSGAILTVDTAAIATRIAGGQGALDVRTEGNPNGNYNPWASNAPVQIYATGVRNAFDLVWTRDGKLYAPTNGSAAGGATPSVPAGTFNGTRIDSAVNGPFTTAAITGIPNVAVAEPDYLYNVERGGYYGHPNPLRGEYVKNGGNPTDGVDYLEMSQYPTGTMPDRNFRPAAYIFGKHFSPNGAIEYTSNTFDGRLDGKLLVTRYAGGADVIVLSRDSQGNITNAQTGIAGLSGFVNPLDITQGVNGSLYIVDYGAQEIVLARPVAPGARIEVDQQTMRFSDDFGSSNTTPSATRRLRIFNTGTQPLSIPSTGLVLSNTTNWVITERPNLPTTVAPGSFVEVGVAFRATSASGAGIRTATLSITSNDPNNPTINVNLRGLATPGTGGMNEPSLQRILDLYQIPVQTGDINPGNTNLLSNTEPLGSNSEEVLVQRFAKAGPGSVTIEPLAVFAGGTPAVRFGYYQAGTAESRTELVWVSQADAQTVNPTLNGTTSFDPGNARFGLYAYFPIFDNYAYSEDSLNTKENTAALRRKFRFYPLKDANGTVVPNAYIFTNEDFNNDPNGATDSNDFVGIIRNVTPALAGPEIGLENRDTVPFADRLVFNRIKVQPPATKTDPITGVVTQPPNNVVHDTAVMRIRNTGADPLTINSVAVNNASVWQIVNAPASGTQIAPGGFYDLTVRFIAQNPPSYPGFNTTPDPTGNAAFRAGFYNGTLTINSNDADEASTVVKLAGWFQEESEKNQEPSLPVLVNNLFGYGTRILNTGQSLFVDGGIGSTMLGEEVWSRYWVRADGSAPVTVKQLAAYHSQGNTATVRWAPLNNPGALTTLFVHDGEDGQSVLPNLDGVKSLAMGSFKPYTASNNPLAAFQFKIDMEWSDDTMNNRVASNPNDTGRHVRFWPAREPDGKLIPNTWIMGMDYLGINYDYQDNLYVVTNMRPMPPGNPAGLAATAQSNGISLAWTAVANAPLLSGYNVYRSTSSTGTYSKLNTDPVTATSFVDSSAAAGVTYFYRVTAIDSWQGESGNSNVVSAVRTADNQPPAPPATLTGVGVNNGVRLNWSAVTDIDLAGYRVYRSDTADGTYTLLNGTPVTQLTFTDTTAANGTTWFYRVTAIDFGGNESSPTSNISATAGDTTAPANPANLAAASVANGIQLNWSAPGDTDVVGYRVYRGASADGTFSLVSGGTLVAVTNWTDTTAAVGETWFYRVTAVDAAANESQRSLAASATRNAVALPTVRINVGGSAFTDSAGRTWQGDQFFTGGTAATSAYDVAGTTDDAIYLARRWGAYTYAIPVANGSYTLSLHFADPLYTTAGKRLFGVRAEGVNILNNFDIAAEGGGRTRLVKTFQVTITDGVLNVQTIKGSIENPLINGIELVPSDGQLDTTAPASPTGLTATAANPRGIALAWNAGTEPDIAGYHVYRATSVNGPWTRLTTSPLTVNSFTHTSATEGVTALYRVTAVDTSGNESTVSTNASATAPVVADGTGLVGRYFRGTAFNTLALTRTDAGVNFDWGTGAPNVAVGSDNFSIRWTGRVKAAVTGNYTFTVRASDGVRLWVNGQQIINAWANSGTTDKVSSTISLTAGQRYDITLEYFESTGAASARLFWEADGLARAIVPRGFLYTA